MGTKSICISIYDNSNLIGSRNFFRNRGRYFKYEPRFFFAISQHNRNIRNKVAFTFAAALGVWGHFQIMLVVVAFSSADENKPWRIVMINDITTLQRTS